jgi:putative ABC transport system permease protein
VIRLIWRGMRFARGRALALAAGLLVAAVAFSLLTASVEVNAAQIKGVVGANWRGEYDLLVQPRGSAPAVTGQHLVQVNYLSAATSGITLDQYHRIAHLAGVGVAAPLAIVGYTLETVLIPIDLSAVAGRSGTRVLMVTSQFTADQGLSLYPAQQQGYVYITPDQVGPLTVLKPNTGLTGQTEQLPGGKTATVCSNHGGIIYGSGPASAPQSSPFGSLTGGYADEKCYSRASTRSSGFTALVAWSFPLLIAGIDPRAENSLTGLGRAVTSGRYLAENAGPMPVAGIPDLTVVPLLGSMTTFDGDTDQVSVTLLPASAVGPVRSGQDPVPVFRALSTYHGIPVLHATITSGQATRELFRQLVTPVGSSGGSSGQLFAQYWTAGPVGYRRGRNGELTAIPVRNPVSVWTSGDRSAQFVYAPSAAADTAFRSLTEYPWTFPTTEAVFLQVTGQFDPGRLTGFAGGPGAPLASYRAPLLTGADQASRTALRGSTLQPSGNIAGYAQQPPLLYTTLAGAAALENPAVFSGTAGQAAAPISSIRVRVSGLHGSIQQQLAKIAAVGQEIEKATGLPVVVTAGASPQRVTIGLAAGKFGRPPLNLTEDWTATQVVLVVLRQADRESLALFVLILVVCGLFLTGAALAGVRGRRTEIGALRAVGWGRRRVSALIIGEVTGLGVLAGLAGAALSAGLIGGLNLDVPLWRAALVLPVAVVLAVLASLGPAWIAALVQPAEALRPAARAPRRKGRRVRTVIGLALTGVARVPGRWALVGAGLAAGVAGLTVLLAAHASFRTSIGDSALAGLVTASARGTDLIAVLLTIGLSAIGIADLTYLNLRERAGELATLAASGWSRWQIGWLLTAEAVLTATASASIGAGAGLAASGRAFGISLPVLGASAAAAAGGVAVALAATIAVLVITSGRPLAAVLAADE